MSKESLVLFGRSRSAKVMLLSVCCTWLGISSPSNASASETRLSSGERPPQFVLLAFDGSKSLSMWRETRAFAQGSKKSTSPKFTYFISGVYFLRSNNRSLYRPPAGIGAGRSDIGFGATNADLETRVDQVMKAIDEGHEMASHANGHFDGQKWNKAHWTQEFDQFRFLLEGIFKNNAIVSSVAGLWQHVIQQAFVGFRAPLLGVSQGLWQTLQEQRYRYDTSGISPSNYWPQMTKWGFWNFPLARLKVAGTCKTTLSMDYNFYVAQSKAKPDSANGAAYEQQMYDSYMAYFHQNYYGNRGPLHIGHHFSKWNGGAYWRAMKRFARSVCSLPEVRCSTYAELTSFMDAQDEQVVAEWQKAQFPPMGGHPLPLVDVNATCDAKIHIVKADDRSVTIRLQGPSASTLLSEGHTLSFETNGTPEIFLTESADPKQTVTLDISRYVQKNKPFDLSVSVRNANGEEILRSTRRIYPTASQLDTRSGTHIGTAFRVGTTDLDEAARLAADPPAAHMDEE